MRKMDSLVASYQDEMVKGLQRLARIKSVREDAADGMPYGPGVQAVLEEALALAKELGFKTRNIDNQVGVASMGEGDEDIALIAHLDVVPEGSNWTYPPYGATLEGDYVYGRGVSDNKGPAIMSLYAIKALVDSGVKFNKTLKVIFGTNEESGMLDLRYYAEHVGTPTISIVPDSSFPIVQGEKGIMNFKYHAELKDNHLTDDLVLLSGQAGNAFNSVPDYCFLEIGGKDFTALKQHTEHYNANNEHKVAMEESPGKLTLRTEGVSAHGSVPEKGLNATSILFSALKPFLKGQEYQAAKFICFYAKHIAFFHHGEECGCHFEDEMSGKLAFNPGMMHASEKEMDICVNIRFPISVTAQEIHDGMRAVAKNYGVNVVPLSDSKGYYHSSDDPVFKQLVAVYREYTGDEERQPVVIGGGTYSRVLKNAYSFGPGLKDFESRAHREDERIYIPNMILATQIYAEALYRLTR